MGKRHSASDHGWRITDIGVRPNARIEILTKESVKFPSVFRKTWFWCHVPLHRGGVDIQTHLKGNWLPCRPSPNLLQKFHLTPLDVIAAPTLSLLSTLEG